MKVEKYGINEGDVNVTNYVPMGTFTICTKDHVRRYLKSSGFGPCIGLALHSEEFKAGVLAHFMSKNGVQHTMERISAELRLRNISSKQRNWTGVVFLGAQAHLGQQTARVEKSTKKTPKLGASSFLDLPSSKSKRTVGLLDSFVSTGKTEASGYGTGLDLEVSSNSMGNAKERAEEILRILGPMAPEYVPDGFGSCVFEVDTGRLVLSEAKISGYNDYDALFATEGQALRLAVSQMN